MKLYPNDSHNRPFNLGCFLFGHEKVLRPYNQGYTHYCQFCSDEYERVGEGSKDGPDSLYYRFFESKSLIGRLRYRFITLPMSRTRNRIYFARQHNKEQRDLKRLRELVINYSMAGYTKEILEKLCLSAQPALDTSVVSPPRRV